MTRGPGASRRALVLLALALGVLPDPAWAQRAVLLVRHAEKVDDSRDPPLSAAGEARARTLARLLADAGITAIYATEFQRTQATARPLADRLGLEVETLEAAAPNELVARLRSRHSRDVVLVVGHSNTVPAILKQLGSSREVTIADPEYDNLFIVVPRDRGEPVVTRLHY